MPYVCVIKCFVIKRIKPNFSTSYCFHNGLLKAWCYAHYFTGSFHLCAKLAWSVYKFVKRPFGNFCNNIVNGRLKASTGFTRDVIFNFIKRISKCNFSGNLCNRITCCFRCKGRGTRNSRIYFDNRIFKTFRV